MTTYTGKVYDIDFLGGSDWVQVLMRGITEVPALIVKEPGIQTVLQAALMAERPVTVEVEDKSNRITSAEVCINGHRDKGLVLDLRFTESDSRCTATIATEDGEVQVYTMDRRPQAILETALALAHPVDQLMYNEDEPNSGEITRVKINFG